MILFRFLRTSEITTFDTIFTFYVPNIQLKIEMRAYNFLYAFSKYFSNLQFHVIGNSEKFKTISPNLDILDTLNPMLM